MGRDRQIYNIEHFNLLMKLRYQFPNSKSRIEHKTMKNYWYNIFPKFNDIKSRKLEYWFEDQVADVYFELQDGNKVAIECQNSPITSQNLIKRTKKYASKDIYVLWVFNRLGSCV
ncbi:hypothetical protein LCGC14_1187030 [marine sediment metagenome]|uniref:Competence protein CoiA nuclease-like domain-containing protein n=1 Tax=marine sediment metagenome TaxID=412755 RepID=A0A0F9M879_9ZZZZ|nr:hypothetical protein [archaeon]